MGVGGNAGRLTPSVNAVDRASASGKGYATIVQDSGHAATVAGKRFVQAYHAAPLRRACFDGCSTGGRWG